MARLRKCFDIHESGSSLVVYEPPDGKSHHHDEATDANPCIRIVSSKRFCLSNLWASRPKTEALKQSFKEFSAGCPNYEIRQVVIEQGGIFLSYRSNDGLVRVVTKEIVGLRLEFEIKRVDPSKDERIIMEYDEDRVLGKLLRIWFYRNGRESKCTKLEDGHFIFSKN